MSEELISGDWAAPEDMAFWRDEVRKRAESWLAEHPNAKMATEIREPEKAAHALYLLAEGRLSKRDVELTVGINGRELWRLSRHHTGTLAEFLTHRKPRLAARYFHLAEKTAEIMERKIDMLEDNDEELSKVNIKDIALSMGIINDKALHLAGEATVKIEHVKSSSMEEFEALRNAARERLASKSVAIEAEIVTHGAEVAET